MPTPSILLATWGDGLFRVDGQAVVHELLDRCVRSLTSDGTGGVLAVVDGHSVYRRSVAGEWTELAATTSQIACCVAIGNAVFVGTDDARIIRVAPNRTREYLAGFDHVAGRATWYAGTAIIDGKVMGPPLGIRSMSATCDGGVLLANVHVGGIPRSVDAGRTWEPTIDIESDVHQVCAHPMRPEIVAAASAKGLCISRDGGATWTIEARGLHAEHCSAVAFGRNDVFVSASTDPFAAQGAVYWRPIDSDGPLQPARGMPQWTEGKVDTDCMAARDATIAVIDASGSLYVSQDDGASWTSADEQFAAPSSLYIC